MNTRNNKLYINFTSQFAYKKYKSTKIALYISKEE